MPPKVEKTKTNAPPPAVPGQAVRVESPTPGQGQGQQPNQGDGQPQQPMTMGMAPQTGHVQPLAVLMPLPPIFGVPIGLEVLGGLDHLFVKQQIELLKVLIGCETANRYDVLTGRGERVFMAQETTDCCTRFCCGHVRPFRIKILDFFGREVLILERPYDCCLCCTNMPFCLCWCGQIGGRAFVYLADGTRLGEIIHVFNNCKPKYHIIGGDGRILMTIHGPKCGDCCGPAPCLVANFPIISSTGHEIGVIRKTFSGFVKEFFTDADNFGVEFPINLDITWKALMFAAVFLIDFMYFEHSS